MKKLLQFILTFGLLFTVGYWSLNQPYSAQTNPGLNAWFLDIGQGDAVLLDTAQDQQVLIDAGPTGGPIIARLQLAMGLGDKSLDLVVISHNHSDHIGGLSAVIDQYQIGEIWLSGSVHTTDTYLKLLEKIKAKQIKTSAVELGKKIEFGELKGVVLTPLVSEVGRVPTNQHDSNVTTLWQYGSTSLLLTGDMETELEQQLVSRQLLSKISVLKVGHHGSETSTGDAFLSALMPDIAVIQAGRNNKFDHPRASTLERLAKFKIPVLRNDQQKTILFEISSTGYQYLTGL